MITQVIFSGGKDKVLKMIKAMGEFKIEDGSLVLADKGVIRLTAREVEKFIESKM